MSSSKLNYGISRRKLLASSVGLAALGAVTLNLADRVFTWLLPPNPGRVAFSRPLFRLIRQVLTPCVDRVECRMS